jgi:hypothetical protein
MQRHLVIAAAVCFALACYGAGYIVFRSTHTEDRFYEYAEGYAGNHDEAEYFGGTNDDRGGVAYQVTAIRDTTLDRCLLVVLKPLIILDERLTHRRLDWPY